MSQNFKSTLICSICHRAISVSPNKDGEPYSVRDTSPVICNECAQHLYYNMQIAEDAYYEQFDNDLTVRKYFKIKPLQEIIDNVKNVVIGQDEQVKNIATTIYKNVLYNNPKTKSNIILIGKTGTGKTESMTMLANEFGIPYVIVDATQFTEAGYVGRSVDDMLVDLIGRAGDDIEKAKRGILIIDEGDKKGGYDNDTTKDVSGRAVQRSLLKILEGSDIFIDSKRFKGFFDTRYLTIVYVGAFENAYISRKNRLKPSRKTGFGNEKADEKPQSSRFIAEDLIGSGFEREFIGRFDLIMEMNSLDAEKISQIITKSAKSPFKYYLNLFEGLGIKVNYSRNVVKSIAQESLRYDTGARAIKSIITYMFLNALNEVLSSPGKYSSVTLKPDIVFDNTKYTLR